MKLDQLSIRVSADTSALRRALWRVEWSLWWLGVAQAVRRTRAEILLSVALLGGWALVTYGIAALSTPLAWPISGGFLLLSLCGWRFLGTLFLRGLYDLTREDTDGP